MNDYLIFADPATVQGATDLIDLFGDGAVFVAAERAERCRNVGNVVRFCRWQQVARLILLLDQRVALGTIH